MKAKKVDYVFNVKCRKPTWNEYLKSKGISTWKESLASLNK